MDSFQDCPPEVRLRIIETIETREDVSALSLASPAMLQQCKVDRARIMRAFVSRDLDGEHLDDALAVILFPRCNAGLDDRKPYIHAHLKRWASGELSAPRKNMDVLLLLKLDSLCQRIWLFIDDFLSKAKAPSLPRAYKMMPRVPTKSSRPGFTSDGLIWSWQRRNFDISKLTKCEKRKVFKAFIRYEIICKIYGPLRKEPANYLDSVAPCDPATSRQMPLDCFSHWKWSILTDYKQESAANQEDPEMLACVREYIVSLYWGLISTGRELRHKPKLKHPEFENSPSLNPKDLAQDPKTDLVISLMASCGFDCLTSMLRLETRHLKSFLRRFSTEIEDKVVSKIRIEVINTVDHQSFRFAPGINECAWICDGYHRLLRQRAKAMFEDDRFFPGIGRLPTPGEYELACREKGFRPFEGPRGEKRPPKGYQHVAYGGLFICLGQKLCPFWQ